MCTSITDALRRISETFIPWHRICYSKLRVELSRRFICIYLLMHCKFPCTCTKIPNDVDSSSRLEEFAWIAVYPQSIHYHTFGCTLFALTTEADQGKAKKLNSCLVLGIYLGPSPHHAGSISLVLSLTTVNASLQFHVGNENFFETTRYNRRNTQDNSN